MTAIYEITPIGSPAVLNTPLRYASPSEEPNGQNGELAFLRLRYKEPGDDTSQLVEVPISPAMGEPNAHPALPLPWPVSARSCGAVRIWVTGRICRQLPLPKPTGPEIPSAIVMKRSS